MTKFPIKNRTTALAYLGLSLVALIVGLSLIFIKIGLKHSSSMDLLAYRFTAGFLSIVLMRIFGIIKFSRFKPKEMRRLWLISLFYPVLFFLFQACGMEYTSASEAGIVFALVPIATLIAASIFLKEKTTFWQKGGIILSVTGIFYILFQKTNIGDNTGSLKGIILELIALGTIIVYYIYGKKIMQGFSAIKLTIWMTIVAFVTFNFGSIAIHTYKGDLRIFIEPLFKSEFIVAVLYLGILSTVLTSFLTNYALSVIPASHTAVFNNLSPIISILGGLFFLDETLYNYHIIGGILVMIGVIITLFFKPKKYEEKNI